MNRYNVECPICGAMNKNLNLDETGGWMECDSCGKVVGLPKYMRLISVPKLNIPLVGMSAELRPTEG